jgi:hypothetical protein
MPTFHWSRRRLQPSTQTSCAARKANPELPGQLVLMGATVSMAKMGRMQILKLWLISFFGHLISFYVLVGKKVTLAIVALTVAPVLLVLLVLLALMGLVSLVLIWILRESFLNLY